ncbi:MAG: hypothetical protein DME25_12870, partial [Verrucomicrobia bacterium]
MGIALALSLGTLICYWPMMGHRFISFHDSAYITQNPRVAAGLSWAGVAWALKSGYVCNWHPLTWLSHMLDCELYGLNPAGHHLTNLLLHAANTLLLLLLLHQLTGARWRSAIVAALFAWHPLHVESVAWAAERKDVLSTFFFLLTLGAYARYATSGQRRGLSDGDAAWTTGPRDCKTPKPQDQIPRSTEHGTGKGFHFSHFTPLRSRHYVLALLLFALGLMSKPMVVTLPFVLLLLDYWPLGRVSGVGRRGPEKPTPWSLVARHGPLLWEKLPFFALAVGSSIVTYLVQNHGRAVVSLQAVPLPLR